MDQLARTDASIASHYVTHHLIYDHPYLRSNARAFQRTLERRQLPASTTIEHSS